MILLIFLFYFNKNNLIDCVSFLTNAENPDPKVTIQSLTIITSDRPGLVIPIPFDPNVRSYEFTLKKGIQYQLKLSFTVSNNIVSGLRYMNTVRKIPGFILESTTVMLGTFSPQNEPYTYKLEEDTTPSGLFSLGEYFVEIKFVDDDNKCYLEIEYDFQITQDWS
ncbi:Rho GDP-dissociation inhibitor 1 [Dendrobium catenatum]|uniref:Rho GDP-dissociation inhibitor 1 n=1 Tax=Dendrobium catenatum TaxID=906689 RepID=A0A2I0XJA0_9ASPA|nr:Rho GDP-dissociation inhibitor 1 [Dendrobium catenatum]